MFNDADFTFLWNTIRGSLPLKVFFSILFFFLGGTITSAFMCLATRVEHHEPWITGRSHCDNCQHILSWWELIPVFSSVFLGCRCPKCHKLYSPIYAIMEALVGTHFVIFFLTYNTYWEVLIQCVGFTLGIILIYLIVQCAISEEP